MSALLVTVNFGRDDSKTHHAANVRRVAKFVNDYLAKSERNKAIVLCQEIGEGDKGYDEHAMLRYHFKGFDFAAERTMTPVLTHGFTISHESVRLASKGIAHVSPSRFVVKAVLGDDHGHELAVLNLHPIQGAFTDPGQSFEPERLADYNKVWNMAEETGLRQLDKGRTVLWGGDMNNPRAGRMFDGEQVLVHHSLDYLVAAERATKVKVLRTGSVNLTIDGHDAQWAEVVLKAS